MTIPSRCRLRPQPETIWRGCFLAVPEPANDEATVFAKQAVFEGRRGAAGICVDAPDEDERAWLRGSIPLQPAPAPAQVDARRLGEQVVTLVGAPEAVRRAVTAMDV